MSATPLLLNILCNPPSLAQANVRDLTPGASGLIPVPLAEMAPPQIPILFSVGDGINPLEDLTGRSYRVSLGRKNPPALGGVALWGDGTVTVPAKQPWNVTDAALQTALNALNGNAGPSSGTVQVNGWQTGAPYTVIWDAVGVRALLTVDVTDIYPEAIAIVKRTQTGSVSVREIQEVQIIVAALTLTTSWAVNGTTAAGWLNLDLPSIVQFLAGEPDGDAVLEIEEYDGATTRKICQLPVVIAGPVLSSQAQTQTAFNNLGLLIYDTDVAPGNDILVTVSFGILLPAVPRVWPVFSDPGANVTMTLVPDSLTASGCQWRINGSTGGVLTTFAVPQPPDPPASVLACVDTDFDENAETVTVDFGGSYAAVPRVWPVVSVAGVNAIATLIKDTLTTSGCQFQLNGPLGASGVLTTFILPQP